MSEQAYKTEVYYRGVSMLEAGYHDSPVGAERSAQERLARGDGAHEVRILDHGGKVLGILEKGKDE